MRYLTLLALCIGCGKPPPPSVDAVEPPREVVAEAIDDVAAQLDTAFASDTAAAPDVATAADTAGPSDMVDVAEAPEAPDAPAEMPDTPFLAPEVRARAETGAPGCVGLGKNGRVLLSIVERGDDRFLRLADFGAEEGAEIELSWPLAPDTKGGLAAAFADDGLVVALEGKKLVACSEVLGKPPLTIPKSVPVSVTVDDRRALVAIEGNRPVPLALEREGARLEVAGAYWSTETGAVFVRLAAPSGTGVTGAEGFALEVLGAPELGMSSCVPRPLNGKPITVAVPAFDPAPKDVSCVAMTADGSKAAFRTWYKSRGEARESAPYRIEWWGPGETPALSVVDLGCMARKCKPEDEARIAAEAAAAGLVGCAVARGAVAVDGMLAPFVYSKNLLRFQGASGWRTVYELEVDEAKGRESLWKAFQLPTGGPVYLYVGYDDGAAIGEGVRVIVLDEGAMSLCPRPPEGTLRIASVNVSGAEKDGGGYKFGGGQAVDGDLTTGWQPGRLAKGESAWIELVLDGDREVEALEIANGFQRKDGNGDLFALNARAAEVVIAFGDGSSEKATLGPDERGYRRVAFAPRKTAKVTLTLAGMHAGTRWADDLALSEVRVIGR